MLLGEPGTLGYLMIPLSPIASGAWLKKVPLFFLTYLCHGADRSMPFQGWGEAQCWEPWNVIQPCIFSFQTHLYFGRLAASSGKSSPAANSGLFSRTLSSRQRQTVVCRFTLPTSLCRLASSWSLSSWCPHLCLWDLDQHPQLIYEGYYWYLVVGWLVQGTLTIGTRKWNHSLLRKKGRSAPATSSLGSMHWPRFRS